MKQLIQKLIFKRALRVQKNIDNLQSRLYKFESMISNIKSWIKEDTKYLNKLLHKLSTEDYLLFGIKTGYIETDEDGNYVTRD